MQNTLREPIRISQPTSNRTQRFNVRRLAPLLTLFGVLALWQAIYTFQIVDSFLIPAPVDVAQTFAAQIEDGSLLTHAWTTFYAAVLGLLIGVFVGATLGYMIARSSLLEQLLSPLIVAFQSTPVVAYAPLLVLWFGTGVESKIVTCALIVFFPMLMNTVVGIRNVPSELRDLMRVSRASRWQVFTKLELPAAMPVLMTGLKTSATLSVIGAVVGEFIAARAGLGFLIKVASSSFNTPLVFVAVITLAVVASTLYVTVSYLESHLLAWQKRGKDSDSIF